MKLVKVSSTDKNNIIDLYKNRTAETLKNIQPKWAYGENVGKLLSFIQNPIHNEYTIFTAKTVDLIKCTMFNDVSLESLFDGKLINDARIAGILFRWENNEFVDPPEIYKSFSFKNKLEINDGRHRTKLSYFLKFEEIPIAVPNTEIVEIGKIISLKAV